MNFNINPFVKKIMLDLDRQGFETLLVGGCVRDNLLGIPSKDLDIEVYGLPFKRLAEILSGYGKVNLVGESFGVLKIRLPDRTECDFSLPRKDSRIGIGHKDFQISFDPEMTPFEAAKRRDFTINAMAFNVAKGQLLDFFDGQNDLKRRILRHTSEAFDEDHLRVLRGMQFAARFSMTVAPETASLCVSIRDSMLNHVIDRFDLVLEDESEVLPALLAKERISEEFMKAMLKGENFFSMMDFLDATGWHLFFPEISSLKSCPQEPEWHPEGDVWTHTCHVLNEAKRICDVENVTEKERAVVMFSALCHDFAKPETLEHTWFEKENRHRWTTRGHEKAGGPIADKFLNRIGIRRDIIAKVVPIVENHLCFVHAENTDNIKRLVRRLAQRLNPATIQELGLLVMADCWGRPPLPKTLPTSFMSIMEMANSENLLAEPPKPLIQGRDVLPFFDNKPGKWIGDICREAMELQLDGAFSSKEEADKWLELRMSEGAA